MNRQRLIISLLAAGILLFGTASAFSVFLGWSEIHPKLTHYKQRIMETDSALTEALDNIAAHVRSMAFVRESQKLDYVRNWVNQNSIHKIDEEHEQYSSKTHVVVPMLWRHHLSSADPPHLACGSRVYAMKVILGKLGIKSRVIDIFDWENASAGAIGLRSHTFLEVWNTETNSWEIQDPDLNLSYQHTRVTIRVSVFQMVMGNIDETEPIDSTGRGWSHLGLLKNKSYFKLAAYRLHYEGNRSVVIINWGRLSPVSRPQRERIMDYLKREFYDPIIFDGTGLIRP